MSKEIKKVYIVTSRRTIEYEGSESEIVCVKSKQEDAAAKVQELRDNNRDINTEFDYDAYNVE